MHKNELFLLKYCKIRPVLEDPSPDPLSPEAGGFAFGQPRPPASDGSTSQHPLRIPGYAFAEMYSISWFA